MAQSFTYAGTALTSVRRSTVSLTEVADMGRVGTGRARVDDAAGSLAILGHKTFVAAQDSCTVPRTWTGYVADQEYGRGDDDHVHAASRQIMLDLVDLNASLAFKLIRGSAWKKRPEETIGARLTALLASAFLSPYVADRGNVVYPSTVLEKGADLRLSRPLDVLNEMAERLGFNVFAYWDVATASAALWFKDSNTSDDFASTLRISNLDAADGVTVFPPIQSETKLKRSPGRVVSGVGYTYKNGQVYRTRAATEATFEARDGTGSSAHVKKKAKAIAKADAFLVKHSTQEDRITTKIRVPKTAVNLVRAGHLIRGRFRQFTPEGYAADNKYFRVLERTILHPLDDDETYDLGLILSPAEGYIAPFCGALARTANGDYWPLGGSNATSISNPSDGVIFYWRGGEADPIYPIVGETGKWNFPQYGVGGSGTIDYAGDASTNHLMFCVVGNGTAAIQTETFGGSPRALAAYRKAGTGGSPGGPGWTLAATGSTGDVLNVALTGQGETDETCVFWIKVVQNDSLSGGKFGWSKMTWARTL